MKAYTDINQSKKLTEILPLKTADMCYRIVAYNPNDTHEYQPYCFVKTLESDIPCWSLAALLNVLPKEIEIDGQRYAPCLFPVQDKWLLKLWYNSNYIFTSPIAIFSDNPVDACVEMIIKLNKQKLL